jgi:hypothetical protein
LDPKITITMLIFFRIIIINEIEIILNQNQDKILCLQ